MSNQLKGLLDKYLQNTINKVEFDELMAYINKLGDQETKTLDQVLQDYWDSLEGGTAHKLSKETSAIAKSKKTAQAKDLEVAKPPVKSLKNKRRKINPVWYAAAATVVIMLGLFGLFKSSWVQDGLNGLRQPKEVQITLTLDNGKVKPLYTDKKEVIRNVKGEAIGTQDQDVLEYTGKDSAAEALAYNTLTVPYGRQFALTLSDNTNVTLNAGSVLRYPESFAANAPRKVYLEKGEAFFEVTKDASRQFIVHTGEIDVQVLGTSFNVSAYPEDAYVNTVLVEGAVRLQQQNTHTDIVPGQMGAFDKDNQALLVEEVDTRLYTAWKDGVLMFRQTPFASICKKLERHFGISIENDRKALEKDLYTATFKGESLSEVLNTFKDYAQFDYIVKDKNTIVIY